MDKIKIEGVLPYDGEYDLDVSYFTNRELNIIKRLSGVRAGELDEAFGAGDNDLIVALAVIALRRAGKTAAEDAIWDAPSGKITFVADEVEADADPPVIPSSLRSDGEKPASSGNGSLDDGDSSQVRSLVGTGSPGSDTGAV